MLTEATGTKHPVRGLEGLLGHYMHDKLRGHFEDTLVHEVAHRYRALTLLTSTVAPRIRNLHPIPNRVSNTILNPKSNSNPNPNSNHTSAPLQDGATKGCTGCFR